nr:HAMP domain-containing sensor histidine kinase [Sporofaciens musculi]
MIWRLFRWMTGYFKEINQGIDALLSEDMMQIHLSPEMQPFERKLNTVKKTLEDQKQETALAEQRKNELVMYLAHDIRTPLTSVIGYLNLLEEEPNMPVDMRAKNVHITLDKAYRLEEMINEFFEITRYNSGQIKLKKELVDIYYLLVQLSDELSPLLTLHGNSVVLNVDENLTVFADPNKLVRVFSNILKNAAAYSYSETEIIISAEEADEQVVISFKNKGNNIPEESLSLLFDKFYRLDKARISNTGGTGLGLAIAKEIIILHGGSIHAASENSTVTFTICLPCP